MHSKTLLPILLLVILAILALPSVFVIGIYQWNWENQATGFFLKVVPLPAAVVNGSVVRLSDLLELTAILQKSQGGGILPDASQNRRQVLGHLIDDKIVADLAAQGEISPTNQEVERYYRYVLARSKIFHSDAGQELNQRLGVGESKFKKIIVLPELVRAKLQIYWLGRATDLANYRLAQRVFQELGSNLDFPKAAETYSEDEASKYLGGDLGFFSREELPPWVSDVVFSLRENEISGVVVSTDGYHIFQVTVRDDRSDPGRVQLRHIYFPGESFEKSLAGKRANYRVFVFDKIEYNMDCTCGCSIVVVRDLPKVKVWVRFPSPAPQSNF